jgi:hypothetical protein
VPLFRCSFKVGSQYPDLIKLGTIDSGFSKRNTTQIGTPKVAGLHIRADESASFKVGLAKVRVDETSGEIRAG